MTTRLGVLSLTQRGIWEVSVCECNKGLISRTEKFTSRVETHVFDRKVNFT